MSKKFPRVTPIQIVNILVKIGFVLNRQSGSHQIFYKDGKRVTVPFHGGKILHPKLLKSILKQADLSDDEFKDLLGK